MVDVPIFLFLMEGGGWVPIPGSAGGGTYAQLVLNRRIECGASLVSPPHYQMQASITSDFKEIQYMYMCLGPLSVVGYCLRVTTCNTRLLYKGAHARKEAELLIQSPTYIEWGIFWSLYIAQEKG